MIQSPSRAVEEDLFEASANRMAKAMMDDEEIAETAPDTPLSNGSHSDADGTDDVFSEDDTPVRLEKPVASARPPKTGESLSDIIADMERDERSILSREETAEALLGQLQDSGIKLTDIFRPKDKKKIAVAARKGESQRRSAINQQVGRQVERVRQRLRGNLEMMTLARDFLALEESDALNALENTHASNKNASARLATYLLLDAAVT